MLFNLFCYFKFGKLVKSPDILKNGSMQITDRKRRLRKVEYPEGTLNHHNISGAQEPNFQDTAGSNVLFPLLNRNLRLPVFPSSSNLYLILYNDPK